MIAAIQDSLTPPDVAKGDPFWQDGACLYLQSVFFHEWAVAKEEGRVGNMNQIMQLVNDEATLATDHRRKRGIIHLRCCS